MMNQWILKRKEGFSMWYCPSCGSQNQGNARFCVECGKPRPEQPAAPQTTPPAGASAPVYGGAPVPPAKPKKKSKCLARLEEAQKMQEQQKRANAKRKR